MLGGLSHQAQLQDNKFLFTLTDICFLTVLVVRCFFNLPFLW